MQAGRAIIGTARKECYLRKEKMLSASRFLAATTHPRVKLGRDFALES